MIPAHEIVHLVWRCLSQADPDRQCVILEIWPTVYLENLLGIPLCYSIEYVATGPSYRGTARRIPAERHVLAAGERKAAPGYNPEMEARCRRPAAHHRAHMPTIPPVTTRHAC